MTFHAHPSRLPCARRDPNRSCIRLCKANDNPKAWSHAVAAIRLCGRRAGRRTGPTRRVVKGRRRRTRRGGGHEGPSFEAATDLHLLPPPTTQLKMDASTSSSPSVRISLKRKAATAATSKLEHVTDDEDGEADEPSSMDESEDGHARDDAARPTDEATQNDDDKTDTALVKAGPAKKAKKELKPKVAVWADLQGWKEGDDPLGRFPVEVLDL